MKSIMVFTWNLELDLPDEDALKACFVDFISALPDEQWPALICIGLQEAKSYSRTSSVFIGDKLVAPELLGGGKFKSCPYKLLATTSFRGVTKKGQLLGQKAQQAIQLLVRGDLIKQVTAKSYQASKGLMSEKGFCGIDATLFGKRLNFISTHLDASSNKERAKDVKAIEDDLKARIKRYGKYHAMFLMGDLNYRVQPFVADMQMDGSVRLSKDVPNDYKPLASDSKYIIELMRDRSGRDMLMDLDTFLETDAFDELPYAWPKFHLDCLPTYKRGHKKSHYKKIKSLKNLMNDKGDYGTKNIPLLNQLYSDKGIIKFKKKRGCWDFGWLDRIGYCVPESGHYKKGMGNIYQFLDYGLEAVAPPGGYHLHSFNHVPYGDHAPVTNLFNMTGFELTRNPLASAPLGPPNETGIYHGPLPPVPQEDDPLDEEHLLEEDEEIPIPDMSEFGPPPDEAPGVRDIEDTGRGLPKIDPEHYDDPGSSPSSSPFF